MPEIQTPHVITITNIKGGVGKTTNIVHLAMTMAKMNKKKNVLAIDLDPQAHMSQCLLPNCNFAELPNSAFIDQQILHRKGEAQQTEQKNLYVIPARLELSEFQNHQIFHGPNWGERITDLLKSSYQDIDFIFIDTPAAYGVLHSLAIYTADSYIISMRPEAFSLSGYSAVYYEIEAKKEEVNSEFPKLAGCILNGVPKAQRRAVDLIRENLKEDDVKMCEIPQSKLFDNCNWDKVATVFASSDKEHIVLQNAYKKAMTTILREIEKNEQIQKGQ